MAQTLTLTMTLEPMGPAGAFVFTDEQVAAIGDGAKAFPVSVSINGQSFALRLARMGGKNLVGLRREIRDAAGLSLGDSAEVTISADTAVRTVEVPDDLATALKGDKAASTAYEALAYSHRKEFVRWITEAKREQTRADRVAKTLEMLKAGQNR